MSYCEIYAICPNGNVEAYGEARNSWGGAMHIWMRLNEKYGFEQEKFPGLDFGPVPTFKPLWRHIGDMPPDDQWVLASTFDRVIVLKPHLATLVERLQRFCDQYPTPTLNEELTILRRADADLNVIGVCWNQASVCSNPWWIYEPKDDEGRPYNIFSDASLDDWQLTENSFAKAAQE